MTNQMSGEPGTERTYWYAPDLGIDNEPLLLSLIKYRQKKNRRRVGKSKANLISSRTTDGRHMPIIDLDFDFRLVPSSTPGHYHLFFDKPIPRRKFVVLMLALWYSGVVELGFAVWSLRRMGNFVRLPGVTKQPGRETNKPEYGWIFKLPPEKRP